MGQYFISFSAKMSVRIRSLHRLSMRAAFSTVAANAQPKVSIDLKQIEPFVDFKQPSKWYPSARNFRRHIICHVGPTNSGKTFAALKKITDAPGIRGIYCAPLRLLAIEVYNKFNKNHKIPCALRTGEISCGPGDSNEFAPSDWSAAPLLSCTVEMADINRPYDIAIIDEIQMMADTQRGWAFTQALLGLQAREIYVCGEESAVPIIKAIAEEIGDTVEIVHFNRLSPLQLSEASLGNKLDRIRPGDCVVAFSRREIFDLKYLIERQTNRKCAVVYGNLPMGKWLITSLYPLFSNRKPLRAS